MLESRSFEKLDEFELPPNEDAPMSMAVHPESTDFVCGINSEDRKTSSGENENLRIFTVDQHRLKFLHSRQTISSVEPEDYQKVARYSRNGSLLALGDSAGLFSLFAYPSLDAIFPPSMMGDGEEVNDVDFNDEGDLVLGCSSKQLLFWSTARTTEKVLPTQSIENPSFKKGLKCVFRSAKFGRKSTASYFFTVVNASPLPNNRKGIAGERKSFVSQWSLTTWELKKTRSISQRSLTAFEVSHDGKFLAYGSSDLSVGVVNAETLHPLLSILRAHDFPTTVLRWSLDDELVVSASADATVRVVRVKGAPSRNRVNWLALLVIIAVILAIAMQYCAGERLRQLQREHLHL